MEVWLNATKILIEKVFLKLMSRDAPKDPQKEIIILNMNITAIKVTPDTLLSNSTSFISSSLKLPIYGLLPIPNRKSKEEIVNDEDIYNMKIINWVSHPLIYDILYQESNIISIEFESLNASRKDKKVSNI